MRGGVGEVSASALGLLGVSLIGLLVELVGGSGGEVEPGSEGGPGEVVSEKVRHRGGRAGLRF